MKFLVSRTTLGYDKKPCDEAVFVGNQSEKCNTPKWAIELNSIQELVDFFNKYGREEYGIVIQESPYCDMLILEIYDDYRE